MSPSGTLNFSGSSTDQFFIIANTSITFESGTTIALQNGAQACNIFWLANTGAITFSGTPDSGIYGTFIAGTSITFAGVSTIDGNLFAGSAVSFAAQTTINAQGVCYLYYVMIKFI
jgi:hypothetical protein